MNKNVKRFFIVACLVVLCSVLTVKEMAYAHIVHKDNAFEDIEFSPYQDDIVVATKLGYILVDHKERFFKPSDLLLRSDLAYWAAVLHRYSENDNKEYAQQEAIANGLLSTLEGYATFNDINHALFAGTLEESSDNTVSREDFARLIVKNEALLLNVVQPLLNFKRASADSIEVKQNSEIMHGYQFLMTENNTQIVYEFAAHPYIVGGPSDASLWEKRQASKIWYSENEQGTRLIELIDFREVSKEETIIKDSMEVSKVENQDEQIVNSNELSLDTLDTATLEAAIQDKNSASGHNKTGVLYAIGIVVVIIVILFILAMWKRFKR